MNLKKRVLPVVVGLGLAFVHFSCAPAAPPAPNNGAQGPVGVAPPPQPIGANPGQKNNELFPPAETDPLQKRIDEVLDEIRSRKMLVTNTGFWTVFHGILGLGPELPLYYSQDSERQVNALEYISRGGTLDGLGFIPTPYGLDVLMRQDLQFRAQGHKDQFIAEMAQWGMPADHKFMVNGKTYVFMDFVRHAQMVSRTKAPDELSWAIIVIADYIGLDATWTNMEGDKLHLHDCLRYEMKQPIVGAACGGTHRLFGLAWVLQRHLLQGGKPEGVWKEIRDHQQKYIDLAKKYQNPDGSFSTLFFQERSDAGDLPLKISTTGHTLEWLALTLRDDQLREAWVQDAVNRLTIMLVEAKQRDIDGGALYHAAHGLVMYHARLYDPEKLSLPFPRGVPLPLPKGYQSSVTKR